MSHLPDLSERQRALARHPLYGALSNRAAVKVFMEYHVYAVWDFMTLLKALQRRLTCVDIPWRPSSYPPMVVRFINEIVLGEESDLDSEGRPECHYRLYLEAMSEVGADCQAVEAFVAAPDPRGLPAGIAEFVAYNLSLAEHGSDAEVAAAFLYGREKLIPEMFERIVAALQGDRSRYPRLLYYLERHIELDGNEHGPLAQQLLNVLIGDDPSSALRARTAAERSLTLRAGLWDAALAALSTAPAYYSPSR